MASTRTGSSRRPGSAGLRFLRRALSREWATPNPEYVDTMHREDSLPAAFSPAVVQGRGKPPKMTPAKVTEAMIAEAWLTPTGHEAILRLAAERVGCQPDEVPVEAQQSLAQLALWVSGACAAGGSIEHLREFLDRMAPKPRRLEIDASVSARRAPMSSSRNPEEAAEAESYYAILTRPPDDAVDAEYEEVAPEDDLSFLD